MSSKNLLLSAFVNRQEMSPGQEALIFSDIQLTNAQLHHAAEQAAAWLVGELGAHPKGQRIVLHLPKSPLTYALWLACIRQGVIYTFADPFGPVSRTEAIIDQLLPSLVVSTQALTNPFGSSVQLSDLSGITGLRNIPTYIPDAETVFLNDPVYVMFTSGSTGRPKGVVVPCRGLVNLMAWAREHVVPMVPTTNENTAIRWANINPLHFDNSVFDLFCGLLGGHSLVPIETGEIANPAQWVKIINQNEVELIFCVPTFFQTLDQLRLLTPKRLPSVRLFAFGGEGFPIQALSAFYEKFKDQANFLNVYGPTETSCICSSIEINSANLDVGTATFPSVGRMHNGHCAMVLLADGTVAEPNQVGELWIGGDGVALGYFNDPDKTKAAFLQTPQHALYSDVWYRTGDLISIDEDGFMWFSGRADNQVKIRGYRIELEEIDAAIERFKGVSRANTIVITRNGADELVTAYVGQDGVSDADILVHCHEHLPKYMLPRAVHKFEKFPQNANGKVDRKSIKAIIEKNS